MSLIDDILQNHLSCPGQLSLITSILGASASWYGHSLLAKILLTGKSVVHMSFIHNASFHLDSMRKLTGVDLGRYNRKGKYLFLDGLSELFHQDRNTPNQDCLKLEPAGLSILTENVLTSILQMGSAGSKPFLVIENPDVLLSAGGVSSVDLLDLLLDWHEVRYSPVGKSN
jgi:elongator complex protein 6